MDEGRFPRIVARDLHSSRNHIASVVAEYVKQATWTKTFSVNAWLLAKFDATPRPHLFFILIS